MAEFGGGVAAGLALQRSTQSGSKAMTAGYTAVYSESNTQPWIFSAGYIDLTNMLAAADSVDIRVRQVITPGGAYVTTDEKNYLGVQPTGHKLIHIDSIMNIYGVEISMRQTAGVLRTFDCEFFHAKRLGL